MNDVHVIESRIKNLKKTKQMTYTMRLASSLKVRQLELRVNSMNQYIKGLRDFTDNVLATIEPNSDLHRSLQNDATGLLNDQVKSENLSKIEELVIILGGQHGLAGGFQSNLRYVLKRDMQKYKPLGTNYHLLPVGVKGIGIAKSVEAEIVDTVIVPEEPKAAVPLIWQKIEELSKNYSISRISVLSNRFYSVGRQKPEFTPILPLDSVHGSARRSGLFLAQPKELSNSSQRQIRKVQSVQLAKSIPLEPELGSWLFQLLRRVGYARIMQLVVESLASEYIQRLQAMTSATKNAEELLQQLEIEFQRSRQSKITQEMLDILGGSEL